MNFLQRAAVEKGVGDPVYVTTVKGDRAAQELVTFMASHGYALEGQSSRKVAWTPMTGVFTSKQKHTFTFIKQSQ